MHVDPVKTVLIQSCVLLCKIQFHCRCFPSNSCENLAEWIATEQCINKVSWDLVENLHTTLVESGLLLYMYVCNYIHVDYIYNLLQSIIPIYRSIYPSIYASIHPSIYPSTYVPMYPFITDSTLKNGRFPLPPTTRFPSKPSMSRVQRSARKRTV